MQLYNYENTFCKSQTLNKAIHAPMQGRPTLCRFPTYLKFCYGDTLGQVYSFVYVYYFIQPTHFLIAIINELGKTMLYGI